MLQAYKALKAAGDCCLSSQMVTDSKRDLTIPKLGLLSLAVEEIIWIFETATCSCRED